MGNEVAVIRDYDIRDRKLVDATAQSTINSTDAIEMKTTDGNQVFIDKASFIKAVGQAFTASDPKTFTKLLGMNGDNSPMGIGASDLASVLGVKSIFSAWVSGTPDSNGIFYWRGVYPTAGVVIGIAIESDNIIVLPYVWNFSNRWFGFKCLYATTMSPVTSSVGFTAYFTAR